MHRDSVEADKRSRNLAGQLSRGRHAAAPPPYLERRGARFVVFSAIGGAIFLMGLGLQAVLTGAWHMQPIASYAIQAVVSVETSFLLNRWLTWRDRGTPFWIAFARFNAQKTVTIALNLALYRTAAPGRQLPRGQRSAYGCVHCGQLRRWRPPGVYPSQDADRQARCSASAGSDADTFQAAGQRRHPVPEQRGNDRSRSQVSTRPELSPSPRDHPDRLAREIDTWEGLAGLDDPRIAIYELETPPGVRDANFKRDAAIRTTSGDLIALVDSDIVLPRDWMSRAVTALEDSGCQLRSRRHEVGPRQLLGPIYRQHLDRRQDSAHHAVVHGHKCRLRRARAQAADHGQHPVHPRALRQLPHRPVVVARQL